MRRIILATALAAGCAISPVAALAQDRMTPGAEMAEGLADPQTQETFGTLAAGMMEVLLEMPVGEFLRAAAEMNGENPADIDPDATVRDMAGPDANALPGRFAEEAPRMMDMMAQMAGMMGRMLPEFEQMAQDWENNVEPPR